MAPQIDGTPAPASPATVSPEPWLTDAAADAAGREVEAAAACSPPPQCFSDSGCDRICGKNNGTCVRVNSCYSECACFSTSPSR